MTHFIFMVFTPHFPDEIQAFAEEVIPAVGGWETPTRDSVSGQGRIASMPPGHRADGVPRPAKPTRQTFRNVSA